MFRSLIFITIICTFFGCGRKGPPLPPAYSKVPAVKNFTGSVENNVLTLRWEPPGGKNAGIVTGYQIYRSAQSLDGDLCEGCPVIFERIKSNDAATCFYSEELKKEMKYIFKVVSFTSNGAVSDDSPFYRTEN